MFGDPLPAGLGDASIAVHHACGDSDFRTDPRTGIVAAKGHFGSTSPATPTPLDCSSLQRRSKLSLAFRAVNEAKDLLRPAFGPGDILEKSAREPQLKQHRSVDRYRAVEDHNKSPTTKRVKGAW
ncbi:hypothetical protein MBLNU459_g8297t3 [Dothideomycetes sp. NU459]